ncbi:MSHA biogenesis protein MshC [Shewanella gelidii]|uniref:MSHA biogenesis protein MshC n=2 Tax=Shewanella gelidii TaxID=1642821 RepID=A0A917JWF6_9GAMM|nr:MSHA biogenesis protein MshC [Shewanella gelidii]
MYRNPLILNQLQLLNLRLKYMYRGKRSGFTLVELVVIIIIIAILAVTALPRLFTQSSYSAYTLQDEIIAELRKTQLMALNNTDRCFRMQVSASGYQMIHFAGRNASNLCQGVVHKTGQIQSLPSNTSITRISDGASTFNIDFDPFGRAFPSCSGPCLQVSSDQTLTVSIESEGYIHEG